NGARALELPEAMCRSAATLDTRREAALLPRDGEQQHISAIIKRDVPAWNRLTPFGAWIEGIAEKSGGVSHVWFLGLFRDKKTRVKKRYDIHVRCSKQRHNQAC